MVTRRVGILVALSTLLLAHQALALAGGDTYFTAQCRVMDTRISMGGPTLAAGEKRVLLLTGSCGPPSDALAVAVNIVVVQPAAAGFAQLFPGDAPSPATSVLNFQPGQIRANNAIVALASDASGTIALVNGSSGPADYVIDISGYFKTGCPPITVSPAGPALPAGTSGTPYSQTFTASGGTGPYTFAVTSGALPANLNLASGGLLSGTPVVAGDFAFTVTATDTATGCTASNAYTLHINCGTLTVAITPTPAQVCSGSAGNSASATAGFATYAWTITNGTIQGSTTGQAISYTAGASGSVGLTVDVTDASACPGQATASVPINANPAPPPIVTSNPQTFTVSGASGTFTLTFNGQTTSSLAFNATAAQVQTALNALSSIAGVGGSTAVTQAGNVYTVTFGGTLTGPQPQMTATGAGGATVVVSSPSVCADSTGNQARGPAGATSYAWTIGNGTITSAANIQTITYTAGSSGNVTLNLTITNPGGCSASNSVLVAINPAPSTPTITPTPAQVCGGSTGNTAAGPAGATSYAWSITNGTITSATNIQTITYTAGASGNVTLNLTVTNASGCPASNSILVPINASPATPSITPTPAQVCANSTGNTAAGPAGATSYAWSIANGTITSATNIQTITYTAGASGNVTLNLTVTNAAACAASNSVLVPISANPAPPAIINSGPQMVTVTGAAGTFTLTFNGQTTSSLAFNATAAQVQTALNALSSIAGVGGSVTVNLAGGVYSVLFGGTLTGPQPLMTASGAGGATVAVSPTACADSTGNQASGPAGATTYAWTITNGAITSATNVQTITYTAGSSGTVTLSLTVTNAAGCSASNSLLVTINPTPATPTITPTPASVCALSTGNTADGPAGAASYAWTITNGTITSATNIQTITYTAGASGNVTLGLTVTNASNCSASNSLDVTINPAPATPTITPTPAQVCAGSTGNTASGPAGATTYAWSITNGTITSATNIQTITYTAGVAAGNVGLTLVVTNAQGCSASNTVNVTKNATPAFTPAAGALSVATFNVAYSLTFAGTGGTAPYTFVLASGALPTGMTLNSNGTVSPNTPSVTGPFAFSITVTDANGCSSTQAYTLNVQPNLQPDAYSGVGNTQLFITGVAGAPATPAVSNATAVLANDTPAGIVVTAGTTACGGIGGSITIDSVGRFIYTPAVNTTGLATCTYTGTSNTIAATGAINITLTNKVWYVNSSTGSDSAIRGRSHEPLLTIAQAVTNSSANEYIFVHKGAATTAGNATLKSGQTLWGEGTTFTLGPLTIPGSLANRPTVTASSGTTLILSTGNTVQGLNVTNSNGSGITGSGVGTLTMGDFDVTVTGGTALGVSTSGTITATGLNTLSATTGTALSVTNVTIGAGGLTFRSISSNGGTNNGITLDTTGASGGLTVTGNGGSCTTLATCTGGAIQSKNGADGSSATQGTGIYLNSTFSPSLTRMDIEGCQNYGIRGISVTNFTLDNSLVGTTATNGTSNLADSDVNIQGEGSVRFTNLLGSATISNTTLDRGLSRSLVVFNNAVGSTLNRLTISNSTIRNTLVNALTSDAFFAGATNNATVNFTVTNSTFSAAPQFLIQTSALGTSTMDIVIDTSTFSNSNSGNASNNLSLSGGGTDTLVTFNIHNNSFRQGAAGSLTAPSNGGRCMTAGMVSGAGKFDGKFVNNTCGVTGVAFSGGGNGADGIGIFASGNKAATTRGTGTTDSRFLIQGNTIKRYGQTGIQISAAQGNSTLDATVFGNTINEPGSAAGGAFAAIWVNAGALPADTSRVDVVIGDSSVAANKNTMQDSDPSNATDVFLDSNSCGGCASVLRLYQNGSGAAGGTTESKVRSVLTDDNFPTLDLLAGFINGSNITLVPVGLPPSPP